MQDDRGSNVGGAEPAGAGAPEAGERPDRERDLAAKSLRAREHQPAVDDRRKEDDVDRGA